MKREFYTGLSQFLFLIRKVKCYYKKRAEDKYHSPGLWTNTACSHPRTGEKTADAAHRRLMEEMGFDCEIEESFSFTYKADVGDGLIEHEYDHVFVGKSDTLPVPNPEEVADYKYVDVKWLTNDVEDNPAEYTVWFKIALKEVNKHFKNLKI